MKIKSNKMMESWEELQLSSLRKLDSGKVPPLLLLKVILLQRILMCKWMIQLNKSSSWTWVQLVRILLKTSTLMDVTCLPQIRSSNWLSLRDLLIQETSLKARTLLSLKRGVTTLLRTLGLRMASQLPSRKITRAVGKSINLVLRLRAITAALSR